jgi:hypothetical protein
MHKKLEGKPAIAIARSQGKQRNFNGEKFCGMGYAVSPEALKNNRHGSTLKTRKTNSPKRKEHSK